MELWTGIRDMFGTRHVGRGIVRETQNRINKHTYNNTTQALGHTHTHTHTHTHPGTHTEGFGTHGLGFLWRFNLLG